jgi:hypothetical protein
MYDFRNILNAEPAAVAEAIRQVLFVGVLLGVFVLDAPQLAGISAAISLVLTLFVRKQVSSPKTVSEIMYGPDGEPAGPPADYDQP